MIVEKSYILDNKEVAKDNKAFYLEYKKTDYKN